MSTNTVADHESTVRQLSDSDVFNLLSSDRRRQLLEILEAEGSATVSKLVERLAERTGQDSERVHISLAHNHLPKLEDYDVVERNGNTVRLGAAAPELRRRRVTNRT